MIDVIVSGAAGKMGSEVVRAVSDAEGMRVVAVVDPGFAGTASGHEEMGAIAQFTDLELAIKQTGPAVMVDFTRPDVVEANLRTALAAGLDCVCGTTGLSQQQLQSLSAKAPAGTCLFMAPNFAIGAVLMMRFAAQAARYMPQAEIIELHHDKKVDAPSGTALRTASLIAQSRRGVPATHADTGSAKPEARGALVEDIPVHSIRLPGLVAHQEVIFGGVGQTLSIRHDSIDRKSFMPGVVLAIREVGERSGLIVGLESLMDA